MYIDAYTESVLITVGIHIIAAFSFYIPFKTGQVSLGQGGFMAIGAYAAGVITVKLGLPFPLGLLFGGVVSGIVGVIVGFPALRIKGIYLLLLTLGFAQIVQVIALNWNYTGGADGFQGIPYQEYTLHYTVAIIVMLVLLLRRMEDSSLGRALVSIHEDEEASDVMGVDIVRMKLLAFGLGAFTAGLAGALFAHWATYVDSNTFDIIMGVEILMFVVVGGSTTYWGPIVGATFLTLLPEFLRELRALLYYIPQSWLESPAMAVAYDWTYDFLDFENEKRLIAYGLILIIMMILRPQGLISRGMLRRAIGKLLPSRRGPTRSTS